MKIAIFSDTHDNLPNFKKAVDWCEANKITRLIHCGDICSPETLKEAIKGFKGQFFLVLGNADKGYGWDSGDLFDFPGVKLFENIGKTTVGKKKIAFYHFPDKAREIAASHNYDFVFYGHTHIPWLERVGKCQLVNPGTLGGVYTKATFAVYDSTTEKLELKLLEKL